MHAKDAFAFLSENGAQTKTKQIVICLPYDVSASLDDAAREVKCLVSTAESLIKGYGQLITIIDRDDKLGIITVEGRGSSLSHLVDALEQAVGSRRGALPAIDYENANLRGDLARLQPY